MLCPWLLERRDHGVSERVVAKRIDVQAAAMVVEALLVKVALRPGHFGGSFLTRSDTFDAFAEFSRSKGVLAYPYPGACLAMGDTDTHC